MRVDQLIRDASSAEFIDEKFAQGLADRLDCMPSRLEGDVDSRNAAQVKVQTVIGSTFGITAGIDSWALLDYENGAYP